MAEAALALPETTDVKAKPFLKWVGGKKGLLPQILKHLPERINTYYEPFLGGGAVFFALANGRRMDGAYLSDCNEELINAFQVLSDCDGLPMLIDLLGMMVYNREFYDSIRSKDPKTMTPAVRAARMIYLNRTGFNGLYRVNRAGKFNVPFGRYKNPRICDESNLRAVHAVLSGLRNRNRLGIMVSDFGIVDEAGPGDAVYFDPPYVPLSATSNFTSYSADGFGHSEQVRLRDLCRTLADKGVTVILSNSDCEVTRDLYQGFTVHSVEARRNVNSKGDRRGPIGEILVVANGA